jgi:mono/diheme cytochrome c family protein
MTRALLVLAVGGAASAQNLPGVLKQGEKVFSGTCATSYCHGVRGTAAGVPRLVGRGFDQAFINNTVTRGVAGTAMSWFAASLSPPDLIAVIA